MAFVGGIRTVRQCIRHKSGLEDGSRDMHFGRNSMRRKPVSWQSCNLLPNPF